MANVQVYNTQTGMTLSIPEEEVRNMSAQWKVGTPPAPEPEPTPPPTTTTSSGGGSSSTTSVNPNVSAMYKKYFDRWASSTERDYWRTRPASELQAQLDSDYKNATGHSYDGTPILEGNNYSQKDETEGTGNAPAIEQKEAEAVNQVVVNGQTISEGSGAVTQTLWGPNNEMIKVVPNSEDHKTLIDAGWGIADGGFKEVTTQEDVTTQQYVYGEDVLGTKANNAAVQTLYQSYFNRPATQAELDNWGDQGGADTTVKALEDYLLGERTQAEQQGVTDLPAIRTIEEIQQQTQPEIGVGATDYQASLWDLPSDLLSSEQFQSLSSEQKGMLELMWISSQAKDEESRRQADEAIEAAKEIVDPINKIMLEFGRQEIEDSFGISKMTTEEQIIRNQENLNEIGKLMENAGIEETSALNSLARGFESKITNLEDEVGGAGLTYSSKRSDLERFIGEQNLDLIQSTKRSAATKLRNLETSKAQAERQETLTREAGEATLREIARSAEEKLGTEEFTKLGLKGIGGEAISAVGGTGELQKFGGSLEQQRQEQILSLGKTIKDFGSPSSLETLFNK